MQVVVVVVVVVVYRLLLAALAASQNCFKRIISAVRSSSDELSGATIMLVTATNAKSATSEVMWLAHDCACRLTPSNLHTIACREGSQRHDAPVAGVFDLAERLPR
jgi:hypothetical protein